MPMVCPHVLSLLNVKEVNKSSGSIFPMTLLCALTKKERRNVKEIPSKMLNEISFTYTLVISYLY